MTPPAARAALLEKAREFNVARCVHTLRSDYVRAIDCVECAMALIDDAVREEREACCKAICPMCAEGQPVFHPEGIESNGYAHRNPFDGGADLCLAAKIRHG